MILIVISLECGSFGVLMKLNHLSPVLVTILSLTFAGAIQAQTNTVASPDSANSTNTSVNPAVPAKAHKIQYSGRITAIDTGANTITVAGKKKTLTLAITPLTTFKGGSSLADFAMGDKVTGSYTTDAAGTMSAASLHKKKTAAKAATPATP
jgi:hypothetical protein